MTLRKIIRFFVPLMALFTVGTLQAEQNPYQLMEETSPKLFGQITKDQAKIKQNPETLRTIVKEKLMPYVHVKYAGSLVLGTQLKTIDKAEREVFFEAFEKFIEQSYAQALTLYTDQKIEIEPAKPIENNIVNVNVKVIQTSAPAVNLNFFWRKNSKTGEWQVYDMAVEGVSMVDTKRQEWSPILRKSGIKALIEQVNAASHQPITLGK